MTVRSVCEEVRLSSLCLYGLTRNMGLEVSHDVAVSVLRFCGFVRRPFSCREKGRCRNDSRGLWGKRFIINQLRLRPILHCDR